MRLSRLFLYISALFMGLTVSMSLAHAEGWKVQHVEQEAKYTLDNKEWFEIVFGDDVPLASWIHVGPEGSLVLARGEERIQLRPNSLIHLRQYIDDVETEIHQRSGEVIIDVDRRNRQHMSVKTPFMAAVVKGTRFGVTSNDSFSSVYVEEGVVSVQDFIRGEKVDLKANEQIASYRDPTVPFVIAAHNKATMDKPESRSGGFINFAGLTISNIILGLALSFTMIMGLFVLITNYNRR